MFETRCLTQRLMRLLLEDGVAVYSACTGCVHAIDPAGGWIAVEGYRVTWKINNRLFVRYLGLRLRLQALSTLVNPATRWMKDDVERCCRVGLGLVHYRPNSSECVPARTKITLSASNL